MIKPARIDTIPKENQIQRTAVGENLVGRMLSIMEKSSREPRHSGQKGSRIASMLARQ